MESSKSGALAAKLYQDYLFILAVAVASFIGINQYHYGMWNQFVSLPWLYDLIDPNLFPNDLLVEQRTASPSFFLVFIKGFMELFSLSIAQAHYILYLLFLVPTIYSFYALGKSFSDNRRSGILAVALLTFAFPVIGDVQTWDSLLMERTIALPFLLLSIASLVKRQYWTMIVLQGIAFNLHPLSAIYVITPSALALIMRDGFKVKQFGYLLLLVALASPVLYLRAKNSVGEGLFAFGETWMEAMRLRNGHHAFPSAYPLGMWLKSGAIFTLFVLITVFGPWKRDLKKLLWGFAIGISLMLLLGLIYTELFPLKIFIQLQFFRSFLFLVIISLAMWSAAIIDFPRPILYMAFLFIVVQYMGVDVTKLLGFVLFSSLAWILLVFFKDKKWNIALLSMAFLALGFAGYFLRGGLKLEQGIQSEEWYEVQDWFAEKSDPEAMVIVPPSELGFRVRAQRSTYGDWFDGTKAFFSEEYARYWLDHMYSLDAYNPANLKAPYNGLQFEHVLSLGQELAEKNKEVYIIRYQESENYPIAESFSNETFKVYRLFP